MQKNNFQRMIELAEEFFDTKEDPTQLSINEEVMARLRQVHPGTMAERTNDDGPIAWVIVIPTTHGVMEEFVAQKINERELLDRTPLHVRYNALYLCSALVLPEHRKMGLARSLTLEAIRSIQKQHPIKDLFYWAYSTEGTKLAYAVAKELALPLHSRPDARHPH